MMFFLYLRHQMLRPFNGTGQQKRKKGHKGRVFSKMAAGLRLSLIDVDHISKRLESIERDTYRKHQFQRHRAHGNRCTRQKRCHRTAQEIKVFEKEQKTEADQQGQTHT